MRGILYSGSMLFNGAGIRDLPNRLEDRTVKVERSVQRGSDGGGCGNILSSRFRDGPLKPPSEQKKGRRRQEGSGGQGGGVSAD